MLVNYLNINLIYLIIKLVTLRTTLFFASSFVTPVL